MLLPNRHGNTSDYRYGFQGYEKDDEVSGEGNSYTTEFRQYDPRIFRWKSIDPMYKAFESPYVAMGNNPILYVDPDGADWIVNDQGFYLWAEEADDIPNGFRGVGNVGLDLPEGVHPYKVLTFIDGGLYHENTSNLFSSIGNALGGSFVEKKPYDHAEESFMSEVEDEFYGVALGKAFRFLGKTKPAKWMSAKTVSALRRVESHVLKGSINKAISESWNMTSTFARGTALEGVLAKSKYKTYVWLEEVSKNYKAFDFFKNGLGVQLKTFDAKKVNVSFYKKAIDKMLDNLGENKGGIMIKKAKLDIGVKTDDQLKLFDKVKEYGKKRGVEVDVYKVE